MLGICKLCHKERKLCDSHYLPAALYRQFREASLPNPNPISITRDITQQTPRQTHDYVLCFECEERFNKYGESWVLGNMFRPTGFPIQAALSRSKPIAASADFAYYSGESISEIDMDALIYFALSIFWRGSAHRWHALGSGVQGIDLGPYQDSIAQFLLGGKFPEHTVVLVSVWPNAHVLRAAHTPRAGKNTGFHIYNFYVPGLDFKLLVGKLISDVLRRLCSHSSPERFVFSTNEMVDHSLDAFKQLASTSRLTMGMKELVETIRKEKSLSAF